MDLAAPIIPKNVKNGQLLAHGTDAAIHATFSEEFVKNEASSEKMGRVVYDEYVQIELQYPGNPLSTYKYRFTMEEGKRGNQWTDRFPRQWEAFCNQKEQVPDGTPIEMWPPLDKKRVYELKAARIFTVEQIAAMSDQNGPNMGLDWRKLRDQAIAFLKPHEGSEMVSKLNRENEDLKSELDVLKRQVAELAHLSRARGEDDLTPVTLEDQPKRRGRPPNSTQAA